MTTLFLSKSATYASASDNFSSQTEGLMLSGHIGADLDSLAQHMRHCASSRNRQSRLQLALQDAHTLVSPRIVTTASLTTLLAVAVASVVVSLVGLV